MAGLRMRTVFSLARTKMRAWETLMACDIFRSASHDVPTWPKPLENTRPRQPPSSIFAEVVHCSATPRMSRGGRWVHVDPTLVTLAPGLNSRSRHPPLHELSRRYCKRRQVAPPANAIHLSGNRIRPSSTLHIRHQTTKNHPSTSAYNVASISRNRVPVRYGNVPEGAGLTTHMLLGCLLNQRCDVRRACTTATLEVLSSAPLPNFLAITRMQNWMTEHFADSVSRHQNHQPNFCDTACTQPTLVASNPKGCTSLFYDEEHTVLAMRLQSPPHFHA